MRSRPLLFAITCSVVLPPAAPGLQAASPDCYERAYVAYARAQRAYQDTLQTMLLAEAPQLEGLIRLAHDQQVALIHAHERAVVQTLRDEPSTVRVDGPVNQWLILGREEITRLRARDSTYDGLRRRADELTGRSNGHKDWPALRVVFRERILPQPTHKAMLDNVMRMMRTAGAECRRSS